MKEVKEKSVFVDLHQHTTFSDGTTTPEQNVKDCALLGLEAIAIADHDHLDGYFRAVKESEKWSIHVIPAVEISTPKYHILAYDFNVRDSQKLSRFKKFIKENREKANEKTYRRAENLQRIGIPITKEKLNSYFPKSMKNKVHIAMAMMQDSECRVYTQGLDSKQIFKKYLSKGCPGEAIEYVELVNPIVAINYIHEAGGKAVIAHPFLDIEDMSELDILVENGLDGLEIQPHFKERNYPFIEYAIKHNLLTTFGSDYHGPRYTTQPLLGREHNNLIIPFWNINNKPKIKTPLPRSAFEREPVYNWIGRVPYKD